MGVLHGEASPSVIYAWEDAAQRIIFRIYAWADDGEHLLYDETTDAFVGVTGASSSTAGTNAPVAHATPPIVVAPRATATSAAIPASAVTASVSLMSPLATGASTVLMPGPVADSHIAPAISTAGGDAIPPPQDKTMMPAPASASAQGRQPVIDYAGNGLISPMATSAAAGAIVPAVAASFTLQAGAATAEVHGNVPSGDINMTAPIAGATASGIVPGLSMGVVPTRVTSAAGTLAPTVLADSTATAPAASATAAGKVPTVTTSVNATVTSPASTASAATAAPAATVFTPMRMNKSGNKSLTTSYVKMNTWVVASGYSGTVITTDGLVMATSGTGRVITASASVTTSGLANTYTIDVRQNGTSIGSQVLTTTFDVPSGTVILTLTGRSVTAGDRLELWAKASNSDSGAYDPRLNGGTTSFLRIE